VERERNDDYQTPEMEVEVSQSPGVLSCKCQSNVDFVSHDFKMPLSWSELLRQETTHAITLKLTNGDNSSKTHMEKYTTEMQVDLDNVRDSNFVRSFLQTYMNQNFTRSEPQAPKVSGSSQGGFQPSCSMSSIEFGEVFMITTCQKRGSET